jgi:hypothetical protein
VKAEAKAQPSARRLRIGRRDIAGRHEDLLEAVFEKTFASEMPARLSYRFRTEPAA